MILKEFSKYLREHYSENSYILLNKWLIEKLKTPTSDIIGKIIQQELYFARNKNNSTLIISRNENGRIMMKSLYNFCSSFENFKSAKKMHEEKN